MHIYFLGGIFDDPNKEMIISDSKGWIQYAADTLQKSYIQGFYRSNYVEKITIINLPFIGSYPARYRKIYYCPNENKLDFYKRINILNKRFFNLIFFKNFSRILSAINGMLVSLRSNTCSNPYIICYSMHLPFLLAVAIVKKMRRNVSFFVVVPDLPEYMVERKKISNFIFKIFTKLSYFIVNKMTDGVIVITNQMGREFSPFLRKVVIEGMADECYIKQGLTLNKKKYFLYSGTLDIRYGIRDLIDAFKKVKLTGYSLYICGDGNQKEYVEKMANDYENIIYLGQLKRERVIELQKEAFVLINPRKNIGDYTKYSFPSKIIEYMSSGTPVMMFKLDGVPEEYYDYCYVIDDIGGLESGLKLMSTKSIQELQKKGLKAKKFIADNKMPEMQVNRFLTAMETI